MGNIQKANNKLADLKPTISITTLNIKVHVQLNAEIARLNRRKIKIRLWRRRKRRRGRKKENKESTDKNEN